MKSRALPILVASVALVFASQRGVITAPTTYYAATSGSDTNSCAQAQNINTPKRTLNNAVTCLSAGSSLIVRGGTYAEALTDNIPSGTAWDNAVTVAAYPGEIVTLMPSGDVESVAHFQGEQYIVLDGLILDGANIAGHQIVKITYGGASEVAAHHIRIKNSELRNSLGADAASGGMGILISAGPGGGGDYNEFINNKIHAIGTRVNNHFSHGVYVDASNNLVDHCEIYDVSGHGLQVYGSDANHDNTISNNRIHDTGTADGAAIGIYGRNNLVYNNVVYGNASYAVIVNYGADGNMLYNNTFFNNFNAYSIGIAAVNTISQNNLIYQTPLETIGIGTIEDHNLIGVDPLFVNAAAFDFHLQRNSPAVDAGVPISAVTSDMDGIARPQGAGVDVGAYEFGGRPPAAPTNVRIVRP